MAKILAAFLKLLPHFLKFGYVPLFFFHIQFRLFSLFFGRRYAIHVG
jgi:hypothetical protein